jgi:hypothetical protein
VWKRSFFALLEMQGKAPRADIESAPTASEAAGTHSLSKKCIVEGEHCSPAEALRQPERCRAVGGTPPYDASISSPACTAAPSPKNAL